MKHYELERNCPNTGFRETTIFIGNLKDKPKGWKLVKEIK
jgi:hypothetical protein